MIQQQTFEVKDSKDELLVISSVLTLLARKNYDEAARVLIARHDKLMESPKLIPYNPRAA